MDSLVQSGSRDVKRVLQMHKCQFFFHKCQFFTKSLLTVGIRVSPGTVTRSRHLDIVALVFSSAHKDRPSVCLLSCVNFAILHGPRTKRTVAFNFLHAFLVPFLWFRPIQDFFPYMWRGTGWFLPMPRNLHRELTHPSVIVLIHAIGREILRWRDHD